MHRPIRSLTLLFILLAAAACGGAKPPSPTAAQPTPIPSATAIPATPTPTLPPAAAVVNGEIITLADFTAEWGRYQAAQKTVPAEDAKKAVIDDLIDQTLLAQAAKQDGYQVDDAALQARLDQIVQARGGADGYQKYLDANGYTGETFRRALRLAVNAAWERDRLIAQAPAAAEQVHARQMLVFDEAAANNLYAKLQAGADFATLSRQIDPLTGGELGWFPRGFLTVKEVEDAAFALQPGQYSPVVHSRLGYHIVQVIQREASRPLDPEALRAVQRQFLQDWLKTRRGQSSITLSLP